MRSTLGSHWAGTGIYGPTEEEFDNHKIERGIKVSRHGMLPTDKFEKKEDFDKYCEQQSGDVKTYNIKDDTSDKPREIDGAAKESD